MADKFGRISAKESRGQQMMRLATLDLSAYHPSLRESAEGERIARVVRSSRIYGLTDEQIAKAIGWCSDDLKQLMEGRG